MASWWLISQGFPDLQPVQQGGKKKKAKPVVEEKEVEREIFRVDDHSSTAQFGDLKLIQSAYKSDRVWTKISSLELSSEGNEVWIRGRLHTSRVKGKAAFFVLRQGSFTLQANLFVSDTTPKEMTNFLKK